MLKQINSDYAMTVAEQALTTNRVQIRDIDSTSVEGHVLFTWRHARYRIALDDRFLTDKVINGVFVHDNEGMILQKLFDEVHNRMLGYEGLPVARP